VFNDHFILAGPGANPAGVGVGSSVKEALSRIALAGGKCEGVFHSRGDGSATFSKERELFAAAGLSESMKNAPWLRTHVLTPYAALERASAESAYLLTDRATFLTAQRGGTISNLIVFVEGGKALHNPCSAMAKPGNAAAADFARWLDSGEAQAIVKEYGKKWGWRMPLFTEAAEEDFRHHERIVGIRLDESHRVE
jgi:ABC-type tungstate transport system permease subunit